MANAQQTNAALVRGFLTDVVGGGDTAAVPAFLTADAVAEDLVFGDSVDRGSVTRLGWRALAGADADVHIEETVASGDRVAVRGLVSGSHRESLVDLAPTGATFEIPCVWFCRVPDCRIAEIRSLPDGLGLLRQLDAIPPRPALRSPPESTEFNEP